MKKAKFYFGAAALLLAGFFQACSSEEPVPDRGKEDPVISGPKVYMNIDITAQTANGAIGRSSTTDQGVSTDGTEPGQPAENTIKNIMVLLVGHGENGKDNCFIAKWTKTFDSALSLDGAGQTLIADFNRSALLEHYAAHSEAAWSNKVSVYVICNYTSEINSQIGTAGQSGNINWLNTVISTADMTKGNVPFWKNNEFLMTNATHYDSEIPSKADIESNRYDSSSNAFSLTATYGSIPVERAVARLDYSPKIDGSQVVEADGDYYYVVAQAQAADAATGATEQPEVRVRLSRMALVNMSKSFYLFRRVSNNGLPTGEGFAIGGHETLSNYVIDPEYQFKSNTAGQTDDAFKSRFHYWMNDHDIAESGAIVNQAWDGYDIKSEILTKGKPDTKYHFWRYITPNTIPGQNSQKAGISTGVIFKAKIEAASEVGVGARMRDQFDIFAFQGKLLGSWADVREMAKKDEGDLKIAYLNAVSADATLDKTGEVAANDWKTLNESQTEAAVKTGGFAKYGYVADGGNGAGAGYFCYYYYWNRHNDNGRPGEMGAMEFGVVRNNVYKLAVTSIKRLGHPFRPGNDPDPVDPDDPDEESQLYMVLSVKVLPWTVRVNNIDF